MLTDPSRAPLGALAAVLAVAVAAGCLAPSGPTGEGADAAAEEAKAGASAAVPRPPAAGRIEMTGCTGFRGGTNVQPGPLAPGQAPPGWEPAATDPWGFVTLAGYECSRIGVGPLERGPVRLVWDAHGRARVPDPCLAGRTSGTVAAVLNALLVDDPGVGAHLRDAFGLPVHDAAITVASRPQAALVEHTWSWTTAGGAASSVTFVDDGQRGDPATADRLFWARGGGIGSLDLQYDRAGPTAAPWPGYGPMQPPMLMAATPQASFAGQASHVADMAAAGTVTLFGDAECRVREAAP